MNKSFELILPGLKGQRILITGGLGFIGSNLAYKCLELGAEVTIYDCLAPYSGGNIYNIHDIKERVELVMADILDFEGIAHHIVDKDILFNCAASTSHSFSMREPLVDLDTNCRGTINLLEAVRRFNRKIKFMHIGTTTQIGKMYYKPIDERHPESPQDIYSANKGVSEKYVLIYGKAYKVPVAVLRFPGVFGPRASIHSSDFTFVNYFIGLAFKERNITVFGDGSQLKNVIYVDDAVSALIMASQTEKANGEVFFAVGDAHYTVAEIANMIAQCIGKGKVEFVSWPDERKITEVGDAVISNEKIKRVLGWRPKEDLSSGLLKTKRYYESCLEHYLR